MLAHPDRPLAFPHGLFIRPLAHSIRQACPYIRPACPSACLPIHPACPSAHLPVLAHPPGLPISPLTDQDSSRSCPLANSSRTTPGTRPISPACPYHWRIPISTAHQHDWQQARAPSTPYHGPSSSSVTLSRRGVRFMVADEPNEAFYFFGRELKKTRDCSDLLRYSCRPNFLGSGLGSLSYFVGGAQNFLWG